MRRCDAWFFGIADVKCLARAYGYSPAKISRRIRLDNRRMGCRRNNISAAAQRDLPEIQPACSLVFPITAPGRVLHRFFAYAMDSRTDRNLRGNGRYILLCENSVRDTNRAIYPIEKNSQSATHAFEPHQLHGPLCIFDPLAIEKPGARIDLFDMGRHGYQRKLRYAALLEVLRQRRWVRRAPLRRGVEKFFLA